LPQTRLETHAEDQNDARKTLKLGRPLLFAGHLLKSGSVLVLRICEAFETAGDGIDPPARVKRQNL
jgi:hypothetical protein